jgi:hypothetical protein
MADWRDLRQQGFLTIALVLAGGVLLLMLIPNLDLRGALLMIAVAALLIGWVP